MQESNEYINEVLKNELHKHAFTLLFATMRERGVTKLRYEFDGGGDDGSCEDKVSEWEGLHANSEAHPNMMELSCEVSEPNGYSFDDKYNRVYHYDKSQCANLEELGGKLAWVVLEQNPYDWVNNEGGHGGVEFQITLEDKCRIFVDMNINVQSSEPHPSEVTLDG